MFREAAVLLEPWLKVRRPALGNSWAASPILHGRLENFGEYAGSIKKLLVFVGVPTDFQSTTRAADLAAVPP
jgi:hypothetical protein